MNKHVPKNRVHNKNSEGHRNYSHKMLAKKSEIRTNTEEKGKDSKLRVRYLRRCFGKCSRHTCSP